MLGDFREEASSKIKSLESHVNTDISTTRKELEEIKKELENTKKELKELTEIVRRSNFIAINHKDDPN